jgi:hypothetical protein
MIDGWGGTSHTRCLRFPSSSTCYEIYPRKYGSCTNFPGSISQFPKEPMSSTRTATLNQTPFSSKFRHFLYIRHSEHSRTGLSFALSPSTALTVLRLRVKQTASRYGRQLLTHRIRRAGSWHGVVLQPDGWTRVQQPHAAGNQHVTERSTGHRSVQFFWTTYAMDNAHTMILFHPVSAIVRLCNAYMHENYQRIYWVLCWNKGGETRQGSD